MLDIGPEKLLVILAVVFIFLGPKELPAAARKISAGIRHLRSFQDSLQAEVSAMLDVPTDVPTPDPGQSEHDLDHTPPSTATEEPGFSGPSSFL
jgi:Sec-independent protein translocase protein TatA